MTIRKFSTIENMASVSRAALASLDFIEDPVSRLFHYYSKAVEADPQEQNVRSAIDTNYRNSSKKTQKFPTQLEP